MLPNYATATPHPRPSTYRPILAGMDANAADPPKDPAAAAEARLRSLITRLAGHDEAALGEFYDATHARVHGLALRITRQRQSAEDVTAEVFWQVWREAPRYDPARGTPLAWLLTIARSRALDTLRRADPAATDPEPENLLADAAAPDGDPADLLAATERGHRLHAALATLDPLPRQLLALAFFSGRSHEEIAAQSALPLGTVKSLIRRALAVLKRALADCDHQESPL